MVLEMTTHSSMSLHKKLMDAYNEMLATGRYEPSWYHTDFTMIPKKGCLSDVKNWHRIALLRITYKIFSKMLHTRLRPLLDRSQSANQLGFDLRKAFDLVEHSALLRALEDQGVPSEHIQLLSSLYSKNQTGCVPGGVKFRKTRGVRQEDILSPLLFNAALEFALRSWKSRFVNSGINLAQQERLTNKRYADNLML